MPHFYPNFKVGYAPISFSDDTGLPLTTSTFFFGLTTNVILSGLPNVSMTGLGIELW
jgi:hypothetical protein